MSWVALYPWVTLRSPTAKSRRHPAFRGRVLRTPIKPNRILPPVIINFKSLACGAAKNKAAHTKQNTNLFIINYLAK